MGRFMTVVNLVPFKCLECLVGRSGSNDVGGEMGFALNGCGGVDGHEIFALRGERGGVEVRVDLGPQLWINRPWSALGCRRSRNGGKGWGARCVCVSDLLSKTMFEMDLFYPASRFEGNDLRGLEFGKDESKKWNEWMSSGLKGWRELPV